MQRKKSFLLTLIMGLLFLFMINSTSIFAAGNTEEDQKNDRNRSTLRILTSFRIKSMNPVKQGFWYSEFGSAELLMKWDRDFTIKPWVLKSLDQIDELRWRLTLRPEVKFQNGKKLDAEALAALMCRQLELSPSAKANLPGTQVKIISEYELELITQTPNPTVPNILAEESVFPIYDVELVDSVGEEYEKLAGKGMFTGPYTVVSLNDQELILNRNEQYWQGVPPLSEVKVGFVSDDQAKMLAVEHDEADIAIYVPSEAKILYQGRDDVFFVTAPNTREGVRLVFNQRSAPFNEISVRKAFGMGINYEVIANNILNGVYEVARGYYPSGFPFSVYNQKYDMNKAIKTLSEDGWKLGKDSIRVKKGQRLHIVMLIYPQQPDLVPIATAIQAQLKEIGFEMEIISVDGINQVMKEDRIPWNCSLVFNSAISGGGVPQLHRYIHSKGDRNYGGINDANLDALIDELQVTFNNDKRIELLKTIQDLIVAKNGYQFFVANKLFPAVVSKAYRNYLPSHNWQHVTFETKPSE